jgi:hypothetical protein
MMPLILTSRAERVNRQQIRSGVPLNCSLVTHGFLSLRFRAIRVFRDSPPEFRHVGNVTHVIMRHHDPARPA